jgi:hypothetical protein
MKWRIDGTRTMTIDLNVTKCDGLSVIKRALSRRLGGTDG